MAPERGSDAKRVEEVEGKGAEPRCRRFHVFLPVHRWRTLPPRDPIVISAMHTNVFIVLLCPIGGNDPITF